MSNRNGRFTLPDMVTMLIAGFIFGAVIGASVVDANYEIVQDNNQRNAVVIDSLKLENFTLEKQQEVLLKALGK